MLKHRMRHGYCVLLLWTGLLLVSAEAQCSGQDLCSSQKLTKVEKAVCSTPALTWDDRKLNALYSLALQVDPPNEKSLRTSEKEWLSQTRNRCSTPACLSKAYANRNSTLTALVAKYAEPLSKVSQWEQSPSRCPACNGNFWVTLVRQPHGKVIGIWEGSVTGTWVMGGLIDISSTDNVLEARILGGRGPSDKAGVALMALHAGSLYVANMFPRSSIGINQDAELFYDVTLRQVASRPDTSNEFGSATPHDLASAWQETKDAAQRADSCSADADIETCIRKRRP